MQMNETEQQNICKLQNVGKALLVSMVSLSFDCRTEIVVRG